VSVFVIMSMRETLAGGCTLLRIVDATTIPAVASHSHERLRLEGGRR
jgi:hypothetical protein